MSSEKSSAKSAPSSSWRCYEDFRSTSDFCLLRSDFCLPDRRRIEDQRRLRRDRADHRRDSQQVVVIDIRPSSAYRGAEGHIPGAISAPFDTIEMRLPELLPYQNQTVLVYGETGEDGAVAAQLLSVAGFRNVVHVNGGIKEWIERGYRTVNAQ